jgi:hypothetical protein
MDTNWQSWEQPVVSAACGATKESKLKLSLEARNRGDIIVVYCHGRIVYRDEAVALSRFVGEILKKNSKLILELSGARDLGARAKSGFEVRGREPGGADVVGADQPGFGAGAASNARCRPGSFSRRRCVRGLLTGKS